MRITKRPRRSNPIALLSGAMFLTGLTIFGMGWEFSRLLDLHRELYAPRPARTVRVVAEEACTEPEAVPALLPEEPPATPKEEGTETEPTPLPQAEGALRIERMLVTAYCPCKKCCGRWARRKRTALGDRAFVLDGVAAAFSLLSPRTRLVIPGIGMREVDDTGGGMRQSAARGVVHIDLRMKTHSEARRWGVKQLPVRIITTGR